MLSRYGFEFEEKGDDQNGYKATNPSINGYNIFLYPLYELEAGSVSVARHTMFYPGTYLWKNTSTAKTSSEIYDIWVGHATIYGAHTNSRAGGNSLRF